MRIMDMRLLLAGGMLCAFPLLSAPAPLRSATEPEYGREREAALARVIVYGCDHAFPPYEFLDAKGRPTGFNIDLARAVAQAIGVDITFQLAPWNETRRKIENGELDIACMFYSASRERLVEFSVPHTLVYQAVFARNDAPPYRRLDDLKGHSIAVQNGYTSDVITQRGMLAEGVQFLSKPFSRKDLARKVREILESRERAALDFLTEDTQQVFSPLERWRS